MANTLEVLQTMVQMEKNSKHKHYLHNNRASGFAFDSMGYISKPATTFINILYSKGKENYRRP